MKNKQFLQQSQHLYDSLKIVQLKFVALQEIAPINTQQLSNQLKYFCKQTLVLKDINPIITFSQQSQLQSIQQILNDNIYKLLEKQQDNYVQTIGYQLSNNYSIKLKLFNFGRVVFQNSLISELAVYTGLGFIQEIIYNYIVLIKYEGEYIQTLGKLLSQKLSNRLEKKKKDIKKSKRSYDYSAYIIERLQMFYCSHMGRCSGIFNDNIFFQNGLKKTDKPFEVKNLVQDALKYLPMKIIKQKQAEKLFNYFRIFITKFRKILARRPFRGNFTSEFDGLLALYCRLPPNYNQIKERANQYINENKSGDSSPQSIFEDLYRANTSYQNICKLINKIIQLTIPHQLLGKQNLQALLKMMGPFISMKRFQNYKIEDFYRQMNVFQMSWLQYSYNPKYKNQIIGRFRMILGGIIKFLFNKCIIPIIKYNFYVTQKHKEGNKIFYFRKPLWNIISKLAVHQFSKNNLKLLGKNQQIGLKNDESNYPQGKLRILPKKGTFRPIITFNRKKKVQGQGSFKGTLNQILGDTQQVLRNLKNVLGTQVGYSVFDNKQIALKYDKFMKNWMQNGRPPLSFFTLDIKKCYDSIDTTKLMNFIKNTPYIEDAYMIVRYNRIYRNKKPLKQSPKKIQNNNNIECQIPKQQTNKNKSFIEKVDKKIKKRRNIKKGKKREKKTTTNNRIRMKYPLPLRFFFNFKQRISAVSLSDDPIKIQEDKNPSINIFTGKNRLITKQQIIKWLELICSGTIILYQKFKWLQVVGIPQGLNVSGVLCSLYFSSLQEKYVKVDKGVLMRLTDDYIYLGPVEQARTVLDSLLKCAQQNSFQFNSEKISANFSHPIIKKISNSKQIQWIGKKINIQTLKMFPAFQSNPQKLFYAMNVNLSNAKTVNCFLKNKLKGLFTNHFSSYFKSQMYDLYTLAQLIKLYTKITMLKFFPFFLELRKFHFADEYLRIMIILGMAIHQFVIYACFLSKKQNQQFYYFLTIQVYQEIYDVFWLKRHIYGIKNILQRLKKHLKTIKQKYQQSINNITQ